MWPSNGNVLTSYSVHRSAAVGTSVAHRPVLVVSPSIHPLPSRNVLSSPPPASSADPRFFSPGRLVASCVPLPTLASAVRRVFCLPRGATTLWTRMRGFPSSSPWDFGFYCDDCWRDCLLGCPCRRYSRDCFYHCWFEFEENRRPFPYLKETECQRESKCVIVVKHLTPILLAGMSVFTNHTYNIRLTNNSSHDSDDDFCSGCRNVSHCHRQQSFSGLLSPGRSNYTIERAYSSSYWGRQWRKCTIKWQWTKQCRIDVRWKCFQWWSPEWRWRRWHSYRCHRHIANTARFCRW